MRVHPIYPTLEYRICDIPTRAEDTIAIAALFQAITAKLYKLIRLNLGFRLYRRMLIQENKWRAVRYGLNGKLIDFGKQTEVPAKDLIHELIQFVDDVVDELGSRKEINHIYNILREGTSADRQLAVFHETGDLRRVVDHVIEETMRDCK
jgi:carboxylate-amine ligase